MSPTGGGQLVHQKLYIQYPDSGRIKGWPDGTPNIVCELRSVQAIRHTDITTAHSDPAQEVSSPSAPFWS